MTHRAHRDHLDHGWTRSPLTDPPPWGESLPDEWLDVELNFYRRTGGTANTIGGFQGRGTNQNYLICHGKAEMETDTDVITTSGGGGGEVGSFKTRHYTIFVRTESVRVDGAVSHDLLPKKGDRVWWYDAIGRRIDVAIHSVDIPEGLADHIEIISEDIE